MQSKKAFALDGAGKILWEKTRLHLLLSIAETKMSYLSQGSLAIPSNSRHVNSFMTILPKTGYISLIKTIYRKYLKEKYCSKSKPKLSFKYFVN